MNKPIFLSLIVTALNEEKNVSPLMKELRTFLDSSGISYEVIFVDDGSRDKTYEEALKFSSWENLRILKLPENLGTGGAIKSAFQVCRGEWYAWLPSDLEVRPSELRLPLSKCHDHDIVVTYFSDGVGSRTWARRILSVVFTKLLNLSFVPNIWWRFVE